MKKTNNCKSGFEFEMLEIGVITEGQYLSIVGVGTTFSVMSVECDLINLPSLALCINCGCIIPVHDMSSGRIIGRITAQGVDVHCDACKNQQLCPAL